jgi:hypothetical protein
MHAAHDLVFRLFLVYLAFYPIAAVDLSPVVRMYAR